MCVCVCDLLTKSLPTSSCSAGRKLPGTCHLRQSLNSTAGTKRLPGLRFRPGMPSRCCHGDAGIRSCSPKEINPFFSPEASCATCPTAGEGRGPFLSVQMAGHEPLSSQASRTLWELSLPRKHHSSGSGIWDHRVDGFYPKLRVIQMLRECRKQTSDESVL